MNMGVVSIIGILCALALMIYLAWNGVSIYVYTLICSAIVILTSGLPVWDTINNTFMGGFVGFTKGYFLVLAFSSVFAKIMGDSGAAKSIALFVLKIAKKSKKNSALIAMLCIMSVSFLLTLGGISTFVVVFLLVSIASSIYEELDIPWHLYATGAWAATTCTMTMIPGTPQVQNLIPMKYLGTTATAAPVLGIVSTVLCITLEIGYIKMQLKKAQKNNEHFLPTGAVISARNKATVVDTEEKAQIPVALAFVPSIVLLLVLNVPVFGNNMVLSMLAGIVTALILFRKQFTPVSLNKTVTAGFEQSLNVVLGVSAIVGFGKVVAASTGYATLIEALENLPGSPLIQLAIVINVVAGFTGSASGGLTIGMESFAEKFLNMGINPQVIHRISAIACGGFDSLPHNSGVITGLRVQGLTHKQAYKHFFWECCFIPIIVLCVATILASFGVV
jgi:H+/gluconate symporter-like permease